MLKNTLLNILDPQSRKKRALILISLGLCVVAALPPFHLWPMAFVGLSGFFLVLDRCTTLKQAFFTAWLFGMGFFGGGLYWLTNAFFVNAAKHGWLVPIAVPALAAAMGLFISLIGLCAHLFWRNHKEDAQVLGRILIFCALWTFFEWVRSWIFTGFPWNLIGTIWGFSDYMIQPAAYLGAFGLSGVTMLGATLPAAFFYLKAPGRNLALLSAFCVPALLWLGGALRLMNADVTYHDNIVLRLVQPNIAQAEKWDRNLKARNFAVHLDLSTEPSETGIRPSHIIWPETAVTYALNREPNVLRAVASVVPSGGAVLTGTPRMTPRDVQPFQVWNSLVGVNETAEIIASYDKSHLVPFGEYIPFRQFIPIPKLTAGIVDFSPGSGRETIQIGSLPAFSPLICYEIIFPGAVANANIRPQWLLNITNDGWYGNSPGPYQHLISARMRSVEEGLPLVRVANTGISVVTDPFGRILSEIPYGKRGFIDISLPQPLPSPALPNTIRTALSTFLIAIFFLVGYIITRYYRKR